MRNTATGAELREEREAADIPGIDLARAMGVHQSRVSQIEALAEVTTKTTRRYRDAVARLQVAKTTTDQGASA